MYNLGSMFTDVYFKNCLGKNKAKVLQWLVFILQTII